MCVQTPSGLRDKKVLELTDTIHRYEKKMKLILESDDLKMIKTLRETLAREVRTRDERITYLEKTLEDMQEEGMETFKRTSGDMARLQDEMVRVSSVRARARRVCFVL